MFLDLQIGNLTEPLDGRCWDHPDIGREQACQIGRFRTHGLVRGDLVFPPFGNQPEFFAELLVIWRLGACAVPIDARLTPFEPANLVAAARARLAVVDDATDPGVLVAVAFGITETGSWVAGPIDADVLAQAGLVGRAWGAAIKVLRGADTTEPLQASAECAVGEAGHVAQHAGRHRRRVGAFRTRARRVQLCVRRRHLWP